MRMYTALTPSICFLLFSDSNLTNVGFVAAIACRGPLKLRRVSERMIQVRQILTA